MRADRARGWSYRKLAQVHGVSLALAYRLARDVHMVLHSPWHRARLPKEAPQPAYLEDIACRYKWVLYASHRNSPP
ncbi:hypothetical protein GCM10027395_06340 [Giesbergeria sinuosa]